MREAKGSGERPPATTTGAPRVSIVTTTYNAAPFIDRYVESLLAQTVADWECIVADDGSTDQTLALLERHAARDPRFRVVATPHRGYPAHGRAVATRLARGAFLAFCDQDDFWFPDKLALQLEAFRLHPDAALCHTGRVHVEFGELPPLFPRQGFDPALIERDSFERALAERCAVTCSSAMAPLATVREVEGIDESLRGVDDYHLWLRLALRGAIVRVKAPLLYCTSHGANLSASPGVLAQGLEDMARALKRQGVPRHLVRLGSSKALKAKAFGCWTRSPWRAFLLMTRSLSLRASLSGLQALAFLSLGLFVPRKGRLALHEALARHRRVALNGRGG